MPRLTAEVVLNALEFLNPFKERELDLRGYKAPEIESLGTTENLYEVIDLSDNEISRLENIPMLPRLKTLLLNNNKITKISHDLGQNLPNLSILALTNNKLNDLADLLPLQELPLLTHLSLLNNPVQKKPYYRQFLIYKLPKLILLDFQKISQTERQEAIAFSQSDQGKLVMTGIEDHSKLINFAPTTVNPINQLKERLTQEEKQKLKQAIANAETEKELQIYEKALQMGKLPKNFNL